MKSIAVLLVLVCSAVGQSKDILDDNGTDWQRSSDSYKTGYVIGYLSAMDNAQIGEAFLCAFGLKLKPDSEESNACIKHAQSLDFTRIAVGQFVQGMDVFYKDFRNTQYPVHAAMRIVRDQINGRAAEDIEKELTSWRQCHADSSKCGIPATANQTPPATKK